jgi:hypothetical protein
VVNLVQQEMFLNFRIVGGAASMEEHLDQLQVAKAPPSGGQGSFPTEEVVNMAAIHKHLRGGYDGDAGSEARWVHKEALTPSVALRLATAVPDSDVEILSTLVEDDPSVLCISSSEEILTDSEIDCATGTPSAPLVVPSSSKGSQSASIPGTLSFSLSPIF